MLNIRVVNKYKEDKNITGIYIGRGSPLGNPYVIGKDGTREEVIEYYRDYLKYQVDNNNKEIIDVLNYIAKASGTEEGINLICFCKPKACHGDVIVEMIKK